MSRYRGPRLRIIRRLGKGVVLPGLTTKTSIKEQPPGKPRATDNKGQKETEYGICLTWKTRTKIQLWINWTSVIQICKRSTSKKRRNRLNFTSVVRDAIRYSLFYIRICKKYCASSSISKPRSYLLQWTKKELISSPWLTLHSTKPFLFFSPQNVA